MTEEKQDSLCSMLIHLYRICTQQMMEIIQEALKDLLSGTIQDMHETEMDNHLGYDRYERSVSLIIVMEQSLKLFVVNMENSKWMYLRIARVPLSLRGLQNARRTSKVCRHSSPVSKENT